MTDAVDRKSDHFIQLVNFKEVIDYELSHLYMCIGELKNYKEKKDKN